jgi:hypothetical protein
MILRIRPAAPADAAALRRLAALDSATVPAEPHLVAERDGRLIAAVSTRDGAAIADPFERTADEVALLRRRAHQLAPRPVRLLRPAGRLTALLQG